MIYDLEKIDLLTTQKDRPTVLCLGITDEVQWEHHVDEHIWLLQEKLNNYITYILNKGYKATVSTEVFTDFVIIVYFASAPDEKAKAFLKEYQSVIQRDGIPVQISYQVVKPNYE